MQGIGQLLFHIVAGLFFQRKEKNEGKAVRKDLDNLAVFLHSSLYTLIY
jgi:hypothetical protein